MRVLVTGGTGFLGTALCKALRDRGDVVIALGSKDADLRQQGALDQFGTANIDWLVHLAAWTQAGDFCLHHPGEQWIFNQQLNTTVLEWWQRAQPQAKLISMGTSCSYDPDLPLTEENYLAGTPIESLFTYAHSKRMLLVGQMALAKQYGLKWLTTVPSTLYGPGYHTDGRQMHFIFDLIRKILRGKLYGEPVVLWGDGYQRRELIFVDDFVGILLGLADSRENEVFNIGAGEEFPIRQFAELICREVDFPFERIQFDIGRYVGAKSKCLDTTKIQQVLPDLKLTPLDSGLATTISWFLSEKEALLPPS